MTLSNVSFQRVSAHILIFVLTLFIVFPPVVQADSPDGGSNEQIAVPAETSKISERGLEASFLPAQAEAELSPEMSPAAFLLMGSLGLGIVGGVSVMVLRMGPDK